ncbi:hypothetical protein K449DRAFT_454546 [Hypoxylon sp. EC38]|nr:hypothetical protein K449DRAFT_454546 [Hypoxylon sp. EC38]
MAEDVTPPSLPHNNNRYSQILMINYAFDNYQYVITPRETEEIIAEPFWDDVDDFINYMMEINFGEAIPGTNNVNPPRTIRIYTDEELDAIDAELIELLNRARLGTHPNEDTGATETSSTVVYNGDSNTNYETHIIYTDEDDTDEDLPLYTPTMLPSYSPYNSTVNLPVVPLEDRGERAPEYSIHEENTLIGTNLEEDIPGEDAPGSNGVVENIIEDLHEGGRLGDATRGTPMERFWSKGASRLSPLSNFSSQIDRKLQKAKQKLARGIEVITPRKALNTVQEIKKRIRQR